MQEGIKSVFDTPDVSQQCKTRSMGNSECILLEGHAFVLWISSLLSSPATVGYFLEESNFAGHDNPGVVVVEYVPARPHSNFSRPFFI